MNVITRRGNHFWVSAKPLPFLEIGLELVAMFIFRCVPHVAGALPPQVRRLRMIWMLLIPVVRWERTVLLGLPGRMEELHVREPNQISFFPSLLCKTGDGSNFKNTLKSYIVSTYIYILDYVHVWILRRSSGIQIIQMIQDFTASMTLTVPGVSLSSLGRDEICSNFGCVSALTSATADK